MTRRTVAALTNHARNFFSEERGQALPFIGLMMVALMGMCGIAVDTGRALYIHRQLQAATDAAAMAGAGVLPASTAASTATSFSAVSGNANARGSLPGVTMVSGYPKVLCLTTLTNAGMTCTSPGNGNAVQVREQIKINLIFLRLVGLKTLNIGAVSTAAMAGGSNRPPYNVAIIVDSTGSMNSTDSDSNCAATRISCALAGVQTLLQNLSPCAPNLSTCGTADSSGNYTSAVDRVAMYTYPALASATDATYEYDCSSSTTPKASLYTDGANVGSNMPLYKVLDYSSDYKTSDTAKTLNSSSNLVKLVGGVSGCTGMLAGLKTSSGGGVNTYAAGAMYAAGLDLINLQSTYPNSQSIAIILTDGDMNAPASNLPNASTSSGNYPSSTKECEQLVSMAGLATGYNITVYTVAYGATSSGCKYDSGAWTPCTTVAAIATAPQNFYSDYSASGGSSTCISSSHPTTGLSSIFQQIYTNLSLPHLIPDNTT